MTERLGIAGSGTIACGLAATAARHGEVVLWARSDASVARAQETIHAVCGRLSGEVNAERVRYTTSLADLSDRTFLVEAVTEHHDVKAPLLARLAEHSDPGAIIATTTSSLSVTALADHSGAPERFCAFHVFNPVPKMRLVELSIPPQAVDAVRTRAIALCEHLGKTAVEVPDVPGFVVNRLLFPFLFSAVRLMEETGLEPDAVDACMTLGAGHPMGPLALLDLIGLDVSVAIGDEISADVPETLRELVSDGALGRKTGRGLRTY
jgi:3-hydroxybutyryl-CoA dehydrogenase